MGQFFIRTQAGTSKDTQYFELSVTEYLNVNLASSVTSSPVETRDVISDHVVRQNKNISISGKLTKYSSSSLTPSADPGLDKAPKLTITQFISALEALHDSGTPVTVYYDNGLPPKKNCVFTAISFSKQSSYGETYDVYISLEQIRVTGRGKFIAEERYVTTVAPEVPRGGVANLKRDLKASLSGGKYKYTLESAPMNVPYRIDDTARPKDAPPGLIKVYGDQPPSENKIPFPLRRPETEWQPKS